MHSRKLLKRVPFSAQVYGFVADLVSDRSYRRTLRQLSHASHPDAGKLRRVLEQLEQGMSPPELDWITRIEAERKRLLDRPEPLADGTLGKGGLYDEGLTIRRACLASKPPKAARLLYLLTRATARHTVIELGTNVGISSAYIGAALKVDGTNASLTTLDASPYRQRLAREIHHNLGIDNISYVQGLFSETLTDALAAIGPVDLAFIDGHHQYRPTLDYFEAILPASAPDAVFVFDDIRWSGGMEKAWAEIQADSRIGLVLDLFSVGICVRSR